MSSAILSTQSVMRRFGGLAAVDNISIDVQDGEIYGIVGPNGAGKSTLFNLIAGVIPPSSGQIHALGRRIDRLPTHRRAWLGIGRTFQTAQSFPSMTVHEALLTATGASRRGLGGWLGPARRRTSSEAIAQVIETVGLHGKEDRTPSALTNLDLQRLAIGLALAAQPKILLLDEPSGGLVMSEVMQLKNLITGIRASGRTVVVIDHKMRLMMQLCDRIMVMSSGRQIALDTPERIASNRAVQEAYLGTPKGGKAAVG